MGMFAQMTGTLTVPEDKKEELWEREYELFCHGGLCAFEEVALYGEKIFLLTPPEIREDGGFCAWHSYFEDDSWEAAGYNAAKGYVWSNKLGWRDFSQVIFAAYILEEQYSTSPCYADIDGRRRALEAYGGWLNYLFDEKYSMQNRNYWNLYLVKRQSNLPGDCSDGKITVRDLCDHAVGYDVDSLYAMLCAENEDSFIESIAKERDPENEFNQNIYDLYHCLSAIKAATANSIKAKNDGNREEYEKVQIENLVAAMCGKINISQTNSTSENVNLWNELAGILKKVIPQIAVRLICDVYDKGFWEIWNMIGDRTTVCAPYVEMKPAIEPISTQDFLTHETRYYLYFWREDNGISLDGLEGWFAELKERYEHLMNRNGGFSGNLSGIQLIVSMMEVLNKANEHYGSIFAFREMFYDFLENCSDCRYQAWWKIFCDLVEENWDEDRVNEEKIRQKKSYILFDPKYLPDKEKPARAEIKGYLGLMANKALRKKVFEN